MINILVCDRFHPEVYLQLKTEKDCQVTKAIKPLKADQLENCDAMIIRSTTPITKELLDKCPQLKFIVSCTSGFNHIDIEECNKRNVCVSYTPNANLYSASELAFTLILNSMKKFLKAQKHIRSGQWKRDQLLGSEAFGKSLGIVGYGRIGSQVAKIAKGFGMKVLAYDPFVQPENLDQDIEFMGFEELLRRSDVISVHVPYTKRTKRMFRKNQFDSMQAHAILVNCSRGNVVSEEEMLLALEEGKFAGAALDVFEKEPLAPENALIRSDKVLCTPHIGGCTEEGFIRGSQMAKDQLLDFFRENKVPDEKLPPDAAWYEDCL
jgi:D-3-phosphoglycerate dehydrogenase